MTSKLREIYPARLVNGEMIGAQSVFQRSGRVASDGIPLAWLRGIADTIRDHILANGGTNDEVDSVVVHGAEHLRATYVDALTPEESMRDELRELRAKLEAVKALQLQDGTLAANAPERLKAILGG